MIVRKTVFRIFILLLLSFNIQKHSIGQKTYDFKNPKLSVEERVNSLINEMTIEEKMGQLMFEAPAIPRLGVRNYSWWNECLHGIARNGRATIFPQAIGLGATFDTDLMHRIGVAIADEGRAKYNANKRSEYMDRYAGLTYWSPNVNLFRDPRWGRGQETYGEDPYHIGQMGVAFVKGLQGNKEKMKVAAMAKHFAVHSGPEKLRHEFDAKVSNYDLWNTYLPAFEDLVVDAKVAGVMGAYNRTNGDPCCAHPYLMDEVLRKKWGFKGYFVSDCWALVDFYAGHKIVKDAQSAAALALKAGCNLNCGNTYPNLKEALNSGLIEESNVNDNLRNLFPTLFKLGIFDPEGSVEYDKIGLEKVRTKENINLSYEAASKSIVLLKNENEVLPIDPNIQTLFVTGPMAPDIQALLANYYGVSEDLKTILEGIVANVSANTAIRYVQGALMDRPNVNPMDWYSEEAEIAEVTIACMGINQLMEGEEGEAIASPSYGDRDYINLPPSQIEFLKLIKSKAKKLVVVITGGSAISSPEVHELADAVVYAWYPGEQGGQAVGDILFGKKSPSGKLPVTFVKSIEDLPAYEDYNMKGRTYRYIDKEVLYPFGFGLSYGKVSIQNMTSSMKKFRKNKALEIAVDIENLSDIAMDEVVQLYIKPLDNKVHQPNSELKKFKRIQLKNKASSTVSFTLNAEDFSYYNDKGDPIYHPGEYQIFIGCSSPTKESLNLGAPQWQELKITCK